MTDTQKPAFTVRDKREERRIAEEALDAYDQSIVDSALPTAAETVVNEITDPEEQVADPPRRPSARARGVMSPTLVIECPHCKCIIKTIDEPTLKLWAQGKPFVGECQDPDCAKTFTVQRPLQPAVQRIPNPPKAVADAMRRGALPGLPLRPR